MEKVFVFFRFIFVSFTLLICLSSFKTYSMSIIECLDQTLSRLSITEIRPDEWFFNISINPKIKDYALKKIYAKTKEQREILFLNEKTIAGSLSNIENPYSMISALQDNVLVKSQEELVGEALDVYLILLNDLASKEQKAKELSSWIKSSNHASFAYANLLKLSKSNEFDYILDYLILNNKFLKNAIRIRGPPKSLITYSFEKESSSDEIAMMYKDPKKTDDEWWAMPIEQRMKRLQDIAENHIAGFRLNAETIAPTALHPSYIGAFSREVGTIYHNVADTFTWEFSSRSYELQQENLIKQMKEIKDITKTADSFHTHLVFEVLSDDKEHHDFGIWIKHLNDYLYLKGMEEGLHGNHLTKVMDNEKKPVFFEGITSHSHKYFSLGVRGGIYGDARVTDDNKKYLKIGLEFRDATRDFRVLEQLLSETSKSVSEERWKKAGINQNSVKLASYDFGVLDNKLKEILPPETINRLQGLHRFYDYAFLPLLEFEKGEYWNYKTNRFDGVSLSKQEQIKAAREVYIKDLLDLIAEIKRMEDKNQTVTKEEIKLAIQMAQSDWAKKAKVSELYQNY